MGRRRTLEEEINDFLEEWDCQNLTDFIRDITPLFDLYDVDEDNDWVKDLVGEEAERTVRLIRTVYLLSRIADFHSGKLVSIKFKFKDLWLRLEKEGAIEQV